MVNIEKLHRLLRINIDKVIETYSKNYFFINFT
jgi:hypothetical protein